ncbi:YebC/PmpR family DNA-binding transcriptional regulator [Orrella sp. 11846]|uniref:YebC/PmpR family DNA-binding transcriptional regulator n=1 Tax=Orrella sp. 11846 TaxID=3409913 RepID=UPI003B59600D
MAGHSKWANIQHRKGRQDAKRGKLWTKIIREITVAAKEGGDDIDSNPRLRLAIEKATAANMPKDNIQRAIQRGSGGTEGENYTEMRYEGYGAGGVAVLVDTVTDNHMRTVAEVRHAFSRNGGNLGQDGCVAYLFQRCGQFYFAPGTSEDDIMNIALENGADDVITDEEEGTIEVLCEPNVFGDLQAAFKEAALEPILADVVMRPETEVEIEGAQAESVQKLIDTLESLDDVQEVFTNASMPSEDE